MTPPRVQEEGATAVIKNLNQVTFQGFGTVLPERAQANQPAPKNAVRMKLTQMEASVYQAKSETMLNCTGDMCVLSVSKDGEDLSLNGRISLSV